MKIFLIFLCIVSLGLFQGANDFESVDIAQAQLDPEIQALIDAGLQTIIEDGLKTDQFQSSNFKLSKINRIMKQEADGDNYKFDCEFVNDEGFALKANFGVNYKAVSGETLVTEYTYKIERDSLILDVENKYSRVLYDDYDRFPQLQELVAYGTDEMIKSCIENGYLANSSYSVISVNRIEKQNYGDALFYKCNVDMQSEDTEMNANFTVYYRPQRDVQTLVDYSCEINSQESGSKDVHKITATIKPLEDKYTPLHEEDVKDNTVATAALDYGTEEIAEYAFEEGKIQQEELEVLKIESVDTQIAGNGAYYRFYCLFGNDQLETVVADFTVFYDAYSTNKSLVSYWYLREEDNGEGEIVIPANIEFFYPEPNKEDEIYGERSSVKPGISIFDVVFPSPASQVRDNVEDIIVLEELVIQEEEAAVPVIIVVEEEIIVKEEEAVTELEVHDIPLVVPVVIEEETIVKEEEDVITEVLVLTPEEYEQLLSEAEHVTIVVLEEQQIINEEDDEQIIYEAELEEHDVPVVVVVEEQAIPVEEEYELIVYEAEVEKEEEEEPVKTVFVVIKNEEKEEEAPPVKSVVVVKDEPEPVKVVETEPVEEEQEEEEEKEIAEDKDKEKQEEEARKEEEKRRKEEEKEREDREKEQEKLREEQEKEREKEAKEREKEREDREKELEKIQKEQEKEREKEAKEREKEREDRDKRRGKD